MSFKLALRNLSRNRRRNLATGLAIALGYTGMVLLGGYAIRIERMLRANGVYLQRTGHIALYKKGGLERAGAKPSLFSLSAEEQQKISTVLEHTDGVEFYSRYLVGMGLLGNGCRSVPFVGTGVEPQLEKRILGHPEVLRVSPELARPLKGRTLADASEVPGAVGLSAGLSELSGKSTVHDEVKGPLPEGLPDCTPGTSAEKLSADPNVQLAGVAYDGSLSAVDGEVVSVFHSPLAETEDVTLLAQLPTLQSLFGTDAVTYMAVFLEDHRRIDEVALRLDRDLQAAGLSVELHRFDRSEVGAYYVGTMEMLKSLVGFIGLLVASVVALSVLNAMTLTLLERTRELGTLRALGFTRSQVLGLLVREAILLSGISVVAGLGLGLSVALAVNAANIRFSPPGIPGTLQLLLTPTPLLCLALAALLVPLSALATYLAARKKARASVVDLLTSSAG